MLLINYKPSTIEKYLGRSLRGTMLQKKSCVMVIIPPPLTPYRQRLISIIAKLYAVAQKAVLKVKKVINITSSC